MYSASGPSGIEMISRTHFFELNTSQSDWERMQRDHTNVDTLYILGNVIQI